ncbi:MAG TPA: serine hydrolase domain-containing protein [Pilimelia sp.]|nr:serine hydrolase domain-containing protein [Pilimelia sp.]
MGNHVADIGPAVAEVNRAYGRPAMVAGLTDPDRLWAVGATGVRRLGEAAPVTVADPFHIGSITKPMSSMVIASLVEQKLLAWTTTPAELFPEAAAGMHPRLRDTTIAALLSHRSGLAGFTTAGEWTAFAGWDDPPTGQRERFAHRVLAAPPATSPGEVLYSNAGYTVAAAMAERVTGRAWEDMFRAHLLAPLRMYSAGFGWPAYAAADAPVGHLETDAGLRPVDEEKSIPPSPLLAAPGDTHMSVADLATFGRAYLNGMLGRDAGIEPGVIRSLHRAVGLDEGDDPHLIFAGSAGTFFAVLIVRPVRRRAIAVMANAGDDDHRIGQVIDQLVEIVTRA